MATVLQYPQNPWPRRLLGGLAAFILLVVLGEVYLRFFPPEYLHPFLGEDSPLTGHLTPDPDFGVGFASWHDLALDNPVSLGPDSLLLPRSEADTRARPWLVLGSSFGYELAAQMRRQFPERAILTLDRREKVTVRLAQVKTLLESGARPEHIVLVLIPNDFTYLAEHDLAHHTANRRGGFVLEPHVPAGAAGAVVRHSRLAFSGWTRLGLHRDHPFFHMRQLSTQVPPDLQHAQEHVFAALARYERKHQVPITVVVIPSKRAMTRPAGFAFEDTLAGILNMAGVRCVDPRPAFLAQAERQALYVPDGHLSELGNRIAVDELMKQVAARTGDQP